MHLFCLNDAYNIFVCCVNCVKCDLKQGMPVYGVKRCADWATKYAFAVLMEESYKRHFKTSHLSMTTTIVTIDDTEEEWSSSMLMSNNVLTSDGAVCLRLTKWEQAMCTLLGGVLSTVVTNPIDVTVAIKQQSKYKSKSVSVWGIYAMHYKEYGVSGCFKLASRGFVPRVMHVCVMLVMIKNVSSWFYQSLVQRVIATRGQVEEGTITKL